MQKACSGASKKASLASDSIPSSLKKEAIERLRAGLPASIVILSIDEMGSVTAKSYPGMLAIDMNIRPAQRARQEIDYGRCA